MILKKSATAVLAIFLLSGCNTTKAPVDTMTSMNSSEETSLMHDFSKNVGGLVWFDYNKSDISAKAKEQLHKQVAFLKKHHHVKATIEGHADERGTRDYNLALGERRAEAVLKFMISEGIAANRLNTISYGKERPLVMGENEAAWAQNRRAATIVISTK